VTLPGRRLALLGGLTAAIGAGYFTIGHARSVLPGRWPCAPVTPLDAWVPFVPSFFLVYLSVWLLWWVPVWTATPARFRQFVIAAALSNAAAFAVFIACRDDPAPVTVTHLRQPLRLLYELLHAVDPGGNRFPSLHATDTVLVLRSIAGEPGARWYVVWGVFVVAASLLTKQHVLADVVAGAMLASVIDGMVRRRTRP
jgi:hypothetical protein